MITMGITPNTSSFIYHKLFGDLSVPPGLVGWLVFRGQIPGNVLQLYLGLLNT